MLLWLAVAALCARAAAAPECPARAGAGLCRSVRGARDETQFYIHDKVLIVSLSAGDTLTLKCQGASLDELSALPAFQALEVVRRLRLHACAAPRPALAAVLRALNATLGCARADGQLCEVMLGALPPKPTLGAALFAGIERLESLDVTVYGDRDAGLRHNASDFLAPLVHLRSLSLTNVLLAEAGLGALPPALAVLKLTSTGVRRLPPAWLRAPLDELWVDSEQALEVQSVPRAAHVTLLSPATNVSLDAAPATNDSLDTAPATNDSLDAAPALRALTVHCWTEPAPRPLAACPQLRELVLTEAAAEALPAGWLARCSRLERLLLQGGARLHQLPPGLLLGAVRLHTLGLRGLGLRALPVSAEGKQLLDPVPDLRDLDLSSNLLSDLPSGSFSGTRQLQRLVLRNNSVTSLALDALRPLTNLSELDLSDNPHLTDFCASRLDRSPLHAATGLRKLYLARTGASIVCSDWCHSMKQLERLDLQHARVTELWFQDVRCERASSDARVLLYGNNVTMLFTNVTEYSRALAGGAANYSRVELDSTLECDCNMYWTRRAQPALQHVSGLRCAERAFWDVAADELQCAAPDECAAFPALPAACACSARPVSDPRERALLVSLRCERANLTRVPAPRARTARRYRLLLAHNNITELTAPDLYDEIDELDLRDNGLTSVPAAAAARLGRVAGALRLADNPLDCSCRAAPLLRALQARRGELAGLLCGDGSALEEAPAADCAPPAPPVQRAGWRVAAALAALLALALLVLVALASRERRFFLKAVLLRLGLLWRPGAPAEEEREYDAFVTFSHEDEAAALALVARLEPAYRLCVHYRDWTPGQLISEQVLESVARSRRTLALVSRHFLASAWACAEFRSAQDAALRSARHRLVVVLLEAPELLPPDARLQAYMRTNTYVRWEDPWLWDKLRVALPPPRARAPRSNVSTTSAMPKSNMSPSPAMPKSNVSPSPAMQSNVSTSLAIPKLNVSPSPVMSKSNVSPSPALPKSHVSPTPAKPKSNVSLSPALPESHLSPTPAKPKSNVSPSPALPESYVSPTPAKPKSIVSPIPSLLESHVTPTPAKPKSNVSPSLAIPKLTVSPSPVMPKSNVSPSPVMPKLHVSPTPAKPKSNVSRSPALPESNISPSPALPESQMFLTRATAAPNVSRTCTPFKANMVVANAQAADYKAVNVSVARAPRAESVVVSMPPIPPRWPRDSACSPPPPVGRGGAESVVVSMTPLPPALAT